MRCQVGDRAAIVGGFRDNIGHLVTVRFPHPKRFEWWIVEVLGSCIGHTDGSPHDLILIPAGRLASIRDKNLWPLRDAPDGRKVEWLSETSEKR